MDGFKKVDLPQKSFNKYQQFNKGVAGRVLKLAKALAGKRIVHINSVSVGGGVAEILRSQIPLEQDLGLKSEWLVIEASPKFFEVTKKIHNRLQGKGGTLTLDEKNTYLKEGNVIAKKLAKYFENNKVDLLIIHDPQPLVAGSIILKDTPKVFRLHIDLTSPNNRIVRMLRRYIEEYDRVILTRSDYRPKWLDVSELDVVMPAIDPLSIKNEKMSATMATDIVSSHGINCDRPLISQISRFDPWKDPIGVVQAYFWAKSTIPHLQLAMVGIIQAKDDPQQMEQYEFVKKITKSDKDVFLFVDEKKLRSVSNDIFINAIQTKSDLIMQKSVREGFGLTVTEAMWKGKTVVGGDAAGIKLQITDRKNGVIVSNNKEAADTIVELLKNHNLREKLGKAAKKTVAEKFLIPSYLENNFSVYKKVLKIRG